MYLTYEEYVDMGGTLDEELYPEREYEVRTIINFYTFNRLRNETEYSEAVKRLTYYLLNYIAEREKSLVTGRTEENDLSAIGIAEESNDGVAMKYNVLTAASRIAILEAIAKKTIRRYLSGEKNSLGQSLLYRGLYSNE